MGASPAVIACSLAKVTRMARVPSPAKSTRGCGEQKTDSPLTRRCVRNGVGGEAGVSPLNDRLADELKRFAGGERGELLRSNRPSRVANPAEALSSSDGGVAPKRKVAGKIGLELSSPVPRRVFRQNDP